MERTIQVRGKARLSVKPDMIRMRLKLEGIREEYREAVEDCAVLQALLVQGILMAGFEQEGKLGELLGAGIEVDAREVLAEYAFDGLAAAVALLYVELEEQVEAFVEDVARAAG